MIKKILKICLSLALALITALSMVACGGKSWDGKVTLKTPGNVIDNGGFLIETQNYVYFINGSQSYTANNAFGTPVKGSLVVADKSGLATGDAKTEIVVPKVLASGDLGAGVYLFGDKLYFATPSTKKDTDGNVANDHLEFCSASLDGKSVTEFLTVKGNSTPFRFVESNGTVFVVYYDSEDAKIVSFNTSTKASTTVVKNPASYKFMDNAGANDAVVIYTETGKDANNETDDSFNVVYAYVAGATEATKLYEGNKDASGNVKAIPTKYAISFVKGEYLFFTTTEVKNETITKTFGATVADFVAKNETNFVEYKTATNVVEGTLFDGLNKAYVIDETFVASYGAGLDSATKQLVAKASDISSLLFVNGDYIYYTNSSSKIARISITDSNAEEEIVTDQTVNTSWYSVKVVDGKYLFYVDSSTYGANYVKYVDLTQTAKTEDTDEDGEIDSRYLEVNTYIGVIASADKVARVETLISEVASISKLTVDENGVIEQKEQIAKARDEYDDLTADQKKGVSIASLEKYEAMVTVSEKLYALIDGVEDLVITEANKADYQAKVDEINKFIEDNGLTSSDKSKLIENGMWAKQTIEDKIADLDAE